MTSSLIRVYEFESSNILENNIISSNQLYITDKVRDAEINNEIWVINQNLKPTKSYLIEIHDYIEGCKDDISYDNLQKFNKNMIDYEEIIDGIYTTIEAIKYKIVPEENYIKNIDLKLSYKKIKDLNAELNQTEKEFMLKHFGIDSKEKPLKTHVAYIAKLILNTNFKDNVTDIIGTILHNNFDDSDETSPIIINNITDTIIDLSIDVSYAPTYKENIIKILNTSPEFIFKKCKNRINYGTKKKKI